MTGREREKKEIGGEGWGELGREIQRIKRRGEIERVKWRRERKEKYRGEKD